MKKRNRIFAMLMALAMVFAYMPALAFADETEEAAPAEVTEEAVENIGYHEPTAEPVTEVPMMADETDETSDGYWYVVADDDEYTAYWWIDDESSRTIAVDVYFEDYADSEQPSLNYYWCKLNGSTEGNHIEEGTVNSDNYLSLEVNSVGKYRFVAFDPNDSSYRDYVDIEVLAATYYTTNIGGINYERYDEVSDVGGAGIWGYNNPNLAGEVYVLSTVTLRNGVTYPVTTVSVGNQGITAIHIPASVKEISNVGLLYDANDNPVARPGFVIYGTFGSPAHAYAVKYGIAFRDLEAERQGTIGAGMQKVKMSKPAAKKTAITVKWKKLTKKQLKKSKATHYEIWVSTDPNFPAGATIEKTVKKSKASLKVKGLKKNTKYYVRVRALKYVNGQKVTGKWSQKTIKTKKK